MTDRPRCSACGFATEMNLDGECVVCGAKPKPAPKLAEWRPAPVERWHPPDRAAYGTPEDIAAYAAKYGL